MRILLFGANGQVGHELRRSLAPLGELAMTTRSGLLADGSECMKADFDQLASLSAAIVEVAPDIVINAAAYTAVDRAEQEPDIAYRANAEAPAIIAETCVKRGIRFVHYSTDYVFDGTGTRPYREDDPTSPLGVYGASKLAGEEAVRNCGVEHMIFRTAWVYADHGKNFMRTMLKLAAERDELRVVADQVGTPTPAALIADITAKILGQQPRRSGTWHLTATGSTSWHGFAEAIVAEAHARGLIAGMPSVLPITTAEFPTPARRPAYSVLDTARIFSEFDIRLPEWRTVMSTVFDAVHPK